MDMRSPASHFVVLAKIGQAMEKGVDCVARDAQMFTTGAYILHLRSDALEGVLQSGVAASQTASKQRPQSLPSQPLPRVMLWT